MITSNMFLITLLVATLASASAIRPDYLEAYELFQRMKDYRNTTNTSFVFFHDGTSHAWGGDNFVVNSDASTSVFYHTFGPKKMPIMMAINSENIEMVHTNSSTLLQKWVDVRSTPMAMLDETTINDFGNDALAVILYTRNCPSKPHDPPYLTACIDMPDLFTCSPVLFGKYIQATCNTTSAFIPRVTSINNMIDTDLEPYSSETVLYFSPKAPRPSPNISSITFWDTYAGPMGFRYKIVEPTLIVIRNGSVLAQLGNLTYAYANLVPVNDTKYKICKEHGNFSGVLDPNWTPELQHAWSNAPPPVVESKMQQIRAMAFGMLGL